MNMYIARRRQRKRDMSARFFHSILERGFLRWRLLSRIVLRYSLTGKCRSPVGFWPIILDVPCYYKVSEKMWSFWAADVLSACLLRVSVDKDGFDHAIVR